MIFDLTFAAEITPLLLEAAKVTIAASLCGYAVAIVLGLIGATIRLEGPRWLSHPTVLVIEFIRSTPLLIQIYFIYLVAPSFGIFLSPFLAGTIALGLHYGAYLTEVFRGGFQSVASGQREAAAALGLRPLQTFRLVVFPQALPPIVPAIGNYFLAMMKETPLLSTISIVEMLAQAKLIGSETFRYIEPLTIVGIIFILFSLAGVFLVNRLERAVQIPGTTKSKKP